MRINSKNIDEYYGTINKKIDSYFGKGIIPSSLMRYLKKDSYGLKRFVEREGLEEIERIDKIIQDCVEDRVAMEESGIMTFENYQDKTDGYNIYEAIDQNVEKIIADMYKVSLGHVEPIKDNHLKVSGIDLDTEVIIVSSKKTKELLLKVAENIFESVSKAEFEFKSLDININLGKKIEKTHFINKIYNEMAVANEKIIASVLGLEIGSQYTLIEQKNNYFIYEKMK